MFKQLSTSLLLHQHVFCPLHAYGEAGDRNFTYPVSLTEQPGAFVLKGWNEIGVSDQSLFPAAGYLQDILPECSVYFCRGLTEPIRRISSPARAG